MRFLREMRPRLQNGCRRDQIPQPHRVHPLRDVHPGLPHRCHSFPLWLRGGEGHRKNRKSGACTAEQYPMIFQEETKMNVKKLITLLLAVMMVLAMAACGAKENDKKTDISGGNTMTDEPKTLEEASALFDSLLAQENAILGENSALWEKVFMAANKDMIMIEDGKNYGQFLLDTIEDAKDQFTEEELKVLREGGEKIRDLEDQLTKLEEKFPELMPETPDGTVSVPAENGKPIEQNSNPFPAFEGKDLDGNPVKSDELFSGNAVTVVNFWFTTCNPCVGELAELDALNKELAEKGGALIGVNTFTLDGDETAISEAKDVLAKKGATYQNVYFASDGEAGKFTTNIFAYPTTYVVDRNGNIVGDPIVGAITEKKQAETLQKLIDQTLAADKG